MMIDSTVHAEVLGLVGAEDFYEPRHADVFRAMKGLIDKREPVDYVTLAGVLRKAGTLDMLGGLPYLLSLREHCFTSAYAPAHAKIVKEKALLRQLSALTREAQALIYSDGSLSDVAGKLSEGLLRVQEHDASTARLRSMSELVAEVLGRVAEARRHKGLVGLSTGFVDIDSLLGGLRNGDLITIGARPSMGKTSLLRKILGNVMLQGDAVGMFSLEMTAEDIVQQMLFDAADLNVTNLNNGCFGDADETKIRKMGEAHMDLPFHCNDITGLNVEQIHAGARRMKMEHDIKLLGVDYLSLISGVQKNMDVRQRVTESVKGLKNIARDLNIPVIVLSQLSRAVEATADKRPMLSHLVESGDIEANSDVVLFLFRPAYYDMEKPINEAILTCAKNRKGRTGEVTLYWEPTRATFKNAGWKASR